LEKIIKNIQLKRIDAYIMVNNKTKDFKELK